VKPVKTFAIVPNESKDEQLKATKKIAETLMKAGVSVILEEQYKGKISDVAYFSRDEMLERADVCVVVGGDGTILDVAYKAAKFGVPIVGINYGNMGFLSTAERDDTEVFNKILDGKFEIDQRMMLCSKIKRNDSDYIEFLALNDVVVFRGQYSRMIRLQVEIDGIIAENYHADGIIVSTPTGSTAYSLSAGGAILDPTIDGIIITPICPHTTRARSLVVAGNRRITIRVIYKTRMDATVAVDGNEAHVMDDYDFVEITKSELTTNLIRLNEKNFFEVLKKKLG